MQDKNEILKKQRLQFLDMTRGFALLLVMVGHCISKDSFLHHFLFTFHVPLFFLISGYVYKYKKRAYIKDFWQLALPYAMVVLIVMISTKIMGGTNYYASMREVIRSAIFGCGVTRNGISLIGAIWFFPTMYFARRYMDFIVLTCKKEQHRAALVAAFVLAAVGLSKEKVWLPLNVDVAMAAVLFMYVGYLLREKNFRLNMETTIVALCLWFASIHCEKINIGKRDYELWYVTFAGAIAASILMIEMFRRIEGKRVFALLNRFLSFTGRHTIVLLCIHDLDWRVPFQIWGSALQAKLAELPGYTLFYIFRRLTYDYAGLFVFLFVAFMVKKIKLRMIKKSISQ